MNILTHDLKDIVQDRIRIDFDTDFRTSILFELLMQREDIKIKLKVRKTLELYYPDLSQISDLETALKGLLTMVQEIIDLGEREITINTEVVKKQLDNWMMTLPNYIKGLLGFSLCES